MSNFNPSQGFAHWKLGPIAGGAFLVGCCVVGPLLIGAACVSAIGVVGELVVIGAVLAISAFALWRFRASRRCC